MPLQRGHRPANMQFTLLPCLLLLFHCRSRWPTCTLRPRCAPVPTSWCRPSGRSSCRWWVGGTGQGRCMSCIALDNACRAAGQPCTAAGCHALEAPPRSDTTTARSPQVGDFTAGIITEILETGTCAQLEQFRCTATAVGLAATVELLSAAGLASAAGLVGWHRGRGRTRAAP